MTVLDSDAELVPLRTEFDLVWRGYDRDRVQCHVAAVEADLRLLAADRDAASPPRSTPPGGCWWMPSPCSLLCRRKPRRRNDFAVPPEHADVANGPLATWAVL